MNWAYLGNYVGGMIGIVSVVLLYITYREQRRSNLQIHYEKMLLHHINVINLIYSRYNENIINCSNKILNLFRFPLVKINMTRDLAECSFTYIYTYYVNVDSIDNTFEELFKYVNYTVISMENHDISDNKEDYVREISFALNQQTKLIMFFYLVANNKVDTLRVYEKYHFFNDLFGMNEQLDEVLRVLFRKTDCNISSDNGETMSIDLNTIDTNTSFGDIVERVEKLFKQTNEG